MIVAAMVVVLAVEWENVERETDLVEERERVPASGQRKSWWRVEEEG